MVMAVVQGQHRQDHSRLASTHVHLAHRAGVLNQTLGNDVLLVPDLQSPLDLKRQPERVLLAAPLTPAAELVYDVIQRYLLLRAYHEALELVFQYTKLHQHERYSLEIGSSLMRQLKSQQEEDLWIKGASDDAVKRWRRSVVDRSQQTVGDAPIPHFLNALKDVLLLGAPLAAHFVEQRLERRNQHLWGLDEARIRVLMVHPPAFKKLSVHLGAHDVVLKLFDRRRWCRSLIHGLHHARAHKLQPLHVVGDSALILAQVEQHRLPKAQHLQPLYLRARRLATETRVTSWTHHLRAYNKMTDAAANVAMESRTSLQCAAPDLRNETGHLQQHLTGDITHWFDQVDAL